MVKTMKTDEAIVLLKQGGIAEDIVLSDIDKKKLGFRDALLLVENGFLVPRGNIVYQDSDVEYDADFDEVIWNNKYSKLGDLLSSKEIINKEDKKNINEIIEVEISVEDKAIQEWMLQNTSKLKRIVNKLIVDLYHTDKILHQNKE